MAEGSEERIQTGPELLARIIDAMRAGWSADEPSEAIAERIWPDVCELVAEADAQAAEKMAEGFRKLEEGRGRG